MEVILGSLIIAIYTIGFIRNFFVNKQFSQLREGKEYSKSELIWHRFNSLQIISIICISVLLKLYIIIPSVLVLWVINTFILAKQQGRGILGYGNGSGSPDERILTKISKITRIKYITLALMLRIIVILFSILSLIFIL